MIFLHLSLFQKCKFVPLSDHPPWVWPCMPQIPAPVGSYLSSQTDLVPEFVAGILRGGRAAESGAWAPRGPAALTGMSLPFTDGLQRPPEWRPAAELLRRRLLQRGAQRCVFPASPCARFLRVSPLARSWPASSSSPPHPQHTCIQGHGVPNEILRVRLPPLPFRTLAGWIIPEAGRSSVSPLSPSIGPRGWDLGAVQSTLTNPPLPSQSPGLGRGQRCRASTACPASWSGSPRRAPPRPRSCRPTRRQNRLRASKKRPPPTRAS